VSQQEGVIKFDLKFTPAPPLSPEDLREINAWRRILHLLGLTGQDPERYDGLGYGNISRLMDASESCGRFVISGTQTGGLKGLNEGHYALVTECDPERNRVVAEGPIRPSSEALTHGTLYRADPSLRFVMHVHSPEIWRRARDLNIPLTDENAAYGTPEMAAEVRRLLVQPSVLEGRIFAMGGHEDGLVAFGRTAEEAGAVLVNLLARAFQLSGI
jgi:hypothetical protein